MNKDKTTQLKAFRELIGGMLFILYVDINEKNTDFQKNLLYGIQPQLAVPNLFGGLSWM